MGIPQSRCCRSGTAPLRDAPLDEVAPINVMCICVFSFAHGLFLEFIWQWCPGGGADAQVELFFGKPASAYDRVQVGLFMRMYYGRLAASCDPDRIIEVLTICRL
eukprot:4975727-Amphidinium_carterae.1